MAITIRLPIPKEEPPKEPVVASKPVVKTPVATKPTEPKESN
jgi:hypothetical protein